MTQEQYRAVTGLSPSGFSDGGSQCPVEQVSWDDAQDFCQKLSSICGSQLPGGYKFSLPTEAQWEYACRAGTTSALNSGQNLTSKDGVCSNLDKLAWYGENSGTTTYPVGQKLANAWGFFDMHGNVCEWCNDWYGDYPSGAVTDPKGPDSGSFRVNRGGSWLDRAWLCRSACRYCGLPDCCICDLGFRLAVAPV